MQPITFHDFVRRWQNTTLGERQGYQAHFNELCLAAAHPPPTASGTDDPWQTLHFRVWREEGDRRPGFC